MAPRNLPRIHRRPRHLTGFCVLSFIALTGRHLNHETIGRLPLML